MIKAIIVKNDKSLPKHDPVREGLKNTKMYTHHPYRKNQLCHLLPNHNLRLRRNNNLNLQLHLNPQMNRCRNNTSDLPNFTHIP